MITQKFEPTVKNSEKSSGIEITNDSLENDTSAPRTNSERSAAIPEVKVETVETPASSPRVTKRAAKPLRPGKITQSLGPVHTSDIATYMILSLYVGKVNIDIKTHKTS